MYSRPDTIEGLVPIARLLNPRGSDRGILADYLPFVEPTERRILQRASGKGMYWRLSRTCRETARDMASERISKMMDENDMRLTPYGRTDILWSKTADGSSLRSLQDDFTKAYGRQIKFYLLSQDERKEFLH